MKPAAIAEVISQLDVDESVRLAVALAFATALRSGDFDRQGFVTAATNAIDWQDPTAIYLDEDTNG